MNGTPLAPRVVWFAIASAVFVAAWVTLHQGLLGASFSRDVPVNLERIAEVSPEGHPRGKLEATDHRFVVWLVSRNARVLASAPSELFQAETCYPTRDALALGEPGISLGLLGIPLQAAFGEPIATYNGVLFAATLIAFVAMYLLVMEWTGVRAAAVVAALLYAFHEIKVGDTIHFYVWENSWTVLALFFATRLFAKGGWPAALGLAAAISMQVAGSAYPLLSAVFVAVPVAIWLAIHHGLRHFRPLQWGTVVVVMLAVAWAVLSPFLAASRSGVLEERGYQVFIGMAMLSPSGPGFAGWVVIALALCSFLLPRRFVVAEDRGDPRWALLVVAVVLFSVSTGGNVVARLEAFQRGEPEPWAWPNLYDALAAVVPGLRNIRGPGALYQNAQTAYVVLAGMGAAALIRRAGARHAGVVAVVLILLAFADTLRPRFLGLEPRVDLVAHEMRPPQEELDFFATLEERGADGPILELPFNPKNIVQSSQAVLLAAYHERPTAQCFNSYLPPEVMRVAGVARSLPSSDGLREIAALGFTTVLLRFDPDALPATLEAFEALVQGDAGATLREVARGRGKIAWDIVPPPMHEADDGD